MNPFDNTFELLQGLRDEINEVRLALIEEQQDRARETNELRQQLIEIKDSKHENFDVFFNTVEELKQAKYSRLEKLESYVEEIRHTKNQRFDILDAKVETEINHREHSCRALDKTIQVEIAHVVGHSQKITREVQEYRKVAELVHANVRNAHEDLVQEVERLGCILRDNIMTRDPLKHFARRPGSTQSSASPAPGAMSSPSPFGNERRQQAGSPSSKSPTLPQTPSPGNRMWALNTAR